MKIALSFAVVALASMLSASHAAGFALSSPTVTDGAALPDLHVHGRCGHPGGNLAPELSWSGVPAGTESFAVTVYDPDAPHPGGWWHWVVFDIPASAHSLPQGAATGSGLPAGAIESPTDFGKPGYGGACPPPGDAHHYVFTIYALRVAKLGLDATADHDTVNAAIVRNTLDKATLTATYER